MKKLVFILAIFCHFSVVAKSIEPPIVEPKKMFEPDVYTLHSTDWNKCIKGKGSDLNCMLEQYKEQNCLYTDIEGRYCQFCDSKESFRILPLAIIDESGNHYSLDEKVCPQREVVCNDKIGNERKCWSKLRNETL